MIYTALSTIVFALTLFAKIPFFLSSYLYTLYEQSRGDSKNALSGKRPRKPKTNALPDKFKKRINKSLLLLERYPDLQNELGHKIASRYTKQIETISERYTKAAAAAPENPANEALFDEGLKTIENKIEIALNIKGENAKDELDTYVRFLQEAD